MLYNVFRDEKLSALGLGCMRLPKNGEKDEDIDEAASAEMVAYALEQGINYFDTAWMYHGGASETVMGRILAKHPRESFYLASKFPGFSKEMFENPRKIFEKQLEKCGVDYFDFYLFHNVCEDNIDNFLNPEYGVGEFLFEQRRLGRIKHLGFSTHGSLTTMKRFLDAYGSQLEFCQIQLNYLDWQLQNAKAKVELVRSYGLPIWVMEPVRGGRLTQLLPEQEARLKALRPQETQAGWAFRFLQGIEGVTMVLSGMSNMEQLAENIKIFSHPEPLNDQEQQTLQEIAREMIAANAVPCTGCSYCVDYCPQGIHIPEILKKYNAEDWSELPDCIGCQSCEKVCPQGISIAEVMADYNRHK